ETVVLSGKMSYHANITAAHNLVGNIMPLVWERRPNVKVVIAGSAPTAEVRALGARHAQRVRVTGYVPTVRDYLQAATLAVAPMPYGAGIQNKVLEALACGTPVVASPQAVAALQPPPGEALRLAESPTDAAAAILELLDDAALRARLGAGGHEYVAQHYNWYAVTVGLESIYDGLVS